MKDASDSMEERKDYYTTQNVDFLESLMVGSISQHTLDRLEGKELSKPINGFFKYGSEFMELCFASDHPLGVPVAKWVHRIIYEIKTSPQEPLVVEGCIGDDIDIALLIRWEPVIYKGKIEDLYDFLIENNCIQEPLERYKFYMFR